MLMQLENSFTCFEKVILKYLVLLLCDGYVVVLLLIQVHVAGKGAPYNPAIAHRLVKELAGIGVAEFQADLGSFYSLGLEPVAKNKDGLLFILQEPRHDLAMLYLTFAAKSGDPLGKMALGYRYLHVCSIQYYRYLCSIFCFLLVLLFGCHNAGYWCREEL